MESPVDARQLGQRRIFVWKHAEVNQLRR